MKVFKTLIKSFEGPQRIYVIISLLAKQKQSLNLQPWVSGSFQASSIKSVPQRTAVGLSGTPGGVGLVKHSKTWLNSLWK